VERKPHRYAFISKRVYKISNIRLSSQRKKEEAGKVRVENETEEAGKEDILSKHGYIYAK